MKIYTKGGDKGYTSLYGGTRVSKDSLQVWCYGTIDEANSVLGTIHATIEFPELKSIVRTIQNKMFTIGANLASDESGQEKLKSKITDDDILYLEGIIDKYTEELGVIKNFTIPGETVTSSLFHVARTVVRRAERLVVNLSETAFVCPLILKYINRLSDTLYILARAEVYASFIKKVCTRIYELSNSDVTCNKFKNILFSDKLQNEMFIAVKEEAFKQNIKVTFSIADENGNLCFTKRIEGAILPSIDYSIKKAYTSAVMKMSTSSLSKETQPNMSLFGLNGNDDRLVIFGGGVPLEIDGTIIGAVGISGGSVVEDEIIAKKAVDAFNTFIKNANEGGVLA